MSSPILDNVIRSITPQIVSAVSARLQEPEGAVEKGLKSAAVALLAAIANRGRDAEFWNQLLRLASDPANSGGTASLSALALGTPNIALMGVGNTLLSLVFDSRRPDAVGALASGSGLSPGSANNVLGLAAPLVLGWLFQQVQDHYLSASALGAFLGGEAEALERSVPAQMRTALSNTLQPPEAAYKGILPLWPVLGVGLLAGVVWVVLHWQPGSEPVTEPPATVTSVNPETQAAMAALGEFFTRKLPTGVELNIPQKGIENRLVQFIEDMTRPVNKDTWFDFDRLRFDTGKATMEPFSQEQLENIANILKAFPNVKIRIGGYTDNQGDKELNRKLSTDRATNVMKELVGMGIAQDRLSAEGYGEDHAVGDNSTAAGRAQNRRISLRVTEK